MCESGNFFAKDRPLTRSTLLTPEPTPQLLSAFS